MITRWSVLVGDEESLHTAMPSHGIPFYQILDYSSDYDELHHVAGYMWLCICGKINYESYCDIPWYIQCTYCSQEYIIFRPLRF